MDVLFPTALPASPAHTYRWQLGCDLQPRNVRLLTATMGHKTTGPQETTVIGAFDLPPAFVPIGLSALLGLAVVALLEKWGKRP